MWPYRTNLGKPHAILEQPQIETLDCTWWEYGTRFRTGTLRTPLSITFAFVATHNHFVLDRGGKVFKRTAPVIKLPAGASEEEHLGLLGLLNSSVACFWLKQVLSITRAARSIRKARVSARCVGGLLRIQRHQVAANSR